MFLWFRRGWCYYRFKEPGGSHEGGGEKDHAEMIPMMLGVRRCTWS